MSLLTDDEKRAIFDQIESGKDTPWFERYANAIESAVLAKLAVMELPEPMYIVNVPYEGLEFADKIRYEITTESERMIVYKADQLRQAYAQGAASQLAQAKADSEWQERNIKSKVDRLAFDLFTRKEPS